MRGVISAAAALATVLAVLGGTALALEKPRPFASYDEMRAEVVRLSNEKMSAKAAAILEKAIDAYPDRLRANTYTLAQKRVRLGEP